ncbi:hypothetical protein [Paraburkholderia lacunae]|uniref:Uncharacterized protein n=1 Tax=Paraburkholderia lacunae TaxID=2211104 RepID=A0A370N3C9_9BURK|nr:hypothetical protein [Paraburkholderia lacunae]RDK00035.1 hypothetical protein DLM46_25355 [Paraburkholderia lacunae]
MVLVAAGNASASSDGIRGSAPAYTCTHLTRALVRAPGALVHYDDIGENPKFDIASGNVAPDRTIGIVQAE